MYVFVYFWLNYWVNLYNYSILGQIAYRLVFFNSILIDVLDFRC